MGDFRYKDLQTDEKNSVFLACGLFKIYNLSFFQALYVQSLHIKSAIPHPLIMGVIRGNV